MPIKNQINRQASGLLSLFLAKVGGQGPRDLREDVQPTVNVVPYLTTGVMRGGYTTATGNPPSNLNITVPQLQYWMIYRMALTLHSDTILAAGEGAAWFMQVQGLEDDAGAATDLNMGLASMHNAGTVGISMGAETVWSPNGNMIMPPGSRIQGQIAVDDTSVNYHAYLSVIYAELAA